MNKTNLNKAKKYFEKCYPNEGCAFLVKEGRRQKFIPIENKMNDKIADMLLKEKKAPSISFLVDPVEYIKYSRNLIAVMHNHNDCDIIQPSSSDLSCQKAMNVPWFIFSINTGKYSDHIQFGDNSEKQR